MSKSYKEKAEEFIKEFVEGRDYSVVVEGFAKFLDSQEPAKEVKECGLCKGAIVKECVIDGEFKYHITCHWPMLEKSPSTPFPIEKLEVTCYDHIVDRPDTEIDIMQEKIN